MKKLKQFGIVAAIYLMLAFIETEKSVFDLELNVFQWSVLAKIVIAFAVFAYVVNLMFDIDTNKTKPTFFSELDEEER